LNNVMCTFHIFFLFNGEGTSKSVWIIFVELAMKMQSSFMRWTLVRGLQSSESNWKTFYFM